MKWEEYKGRGGIGGLYTEDTSTAAAYSKSAAMADIGLASQAAAYSAKPVANPGHLARGRLICFTFSVATSGNSYE